MNATKPDPKPRTKYSTCPECEANFRVSDAREPLPSHREFSGPGMCPGAGKPGN